LFGKREVTPRSKMPGGCVHGSDGKGVGGCANWVVEKITRLKRRGLGWDHCANRKKEKSKG